MGFRRISSYIFRTQESTPAKPAEVLEMQSLNVQRATGSIFSQFDWKHAAEGKVKNIYFVESKKILKSTDKTTASTLGSMPHYALMKAKGGVEGFILGKKQELQEEVELMKRLDEIEHPGKKYLATTVLEDGTDSVTGEYYAIVPRAEETFESFLQDPSVALETRLELFHQMMQGLEALHSAGYAYGDIKPENCLVYKDPTSPCGYTLKIADFGKTKELSAKDKATYSGNPRFCPPEGMLSQKGDVWSCAIILIRILEEPILDPTKGPVIAVPEENRDPLNQPSEKRRGVESYICQHDAFKAIDVTAATKLYDIMRRSQMSSLTDREKEIEVRLLSSYFDEVLIKLGISAEDAKKLQDVFTSMIVSDPEVRITSQEASQRLLGVKTVEIAALNQVAAQKKAVKLGPAKALLENLSQRPIDFVRFNQLADGLKKETNWQLAVEHEMSEEKALAVIYMPADARRGCDREVMELLLKVAKEKVKNQLTDYEIDAIDDTIAYLKTPIGENILLQLLGAGAVNRVYTFTRNQETYVFKPDPSQLDSITTVKEQLFGTAVLSGIPAGKEAHLPYRAVASSKVDQMLFKDKPVSVMTNFVIINGQRGIEMHKAKGKSPVARTEKKPETVVFSDKAKQFLEKKQNLTQKDLQMVGVMSGYRDVKVVSVNPLRLEGVKVHYEGLDPNNATTAEGLVKLQIKDIITGESDRHPKNYFIDSDGTVTGIDEDCCFGKNALPDQGDIRRRASVYGVIPNNASLMMRMPPVVTREVKNQVEALSKDRAALKKMLRHYITNEEIDATMSRLDALVEHLNNPEMCLVVETKEELLSDAARDKIDSNNSYFARELFVFESDKKGWNYLREHRPF